MPPCWTRIPLLELNLDQIWHMVDELLEAHEGWIPALS